MKSPWQAALLLAAFIDVVRIRAAPFVDIVPIPLLPPNAAELRKRGVDHRGFALLPLIPCPRRPRIGDSAAVPRPCQGRREGASRLSRLAVDGSPAPEEGRAGEDQLWAARKRANEEAPTTKRSPAIGRLDVRPAQPWRPPGWRNCWRAALLAASILSSCFLLTQAKGEKETVIKMDTEHPEGGGSVTFTPVDLDVGNLNTFIWYRGETEETSRIFTYILVPSRIQNNGPSFTERETGGLDSSLNIRDLWLNDSGLYTLTAKVSSGTVIGFIVLNVLGTVSTFRIRLTSITSRASLTQNPPRPVLQCIGKNKIQTHIG
ncbi:uncharacterized protein LOC128419032 [Podarcis raffonei]|uniref:uncharacterized protein LOC128419032 n=1 Tax=Podarcis raffonei TaxID=65483 RepID=UPI0023290A07|nr:uncharacterized protein LOC128419032 [Podarcis raffonei]